MKIISLLLLAFSNFVIAESCEQLASHDEKLLKVKVSNLSEAVIQLDINAPSSIKGQKIASAQIIQIDSNMPFFLVPISFPFSTSTSTSTEAVTQIFLPASVYSGGEVQIFYKGTPCNSVLSKKFT